MVKKYKRVSTEFDVLVCTKCPAEKGICHIDCKEPDCPETLGHPMMNPLPDGCTIQKAIKPGKKDCIMMEDGFCIKCSENNDTDCTWKDHIIAKEIYEEYEEEESNDAAIARQNENMGNLSNSEIEIVQKIQ